MKKALIISYYFPPSGGPGVQRILKFVRYLPEFGWEPIVLTVEDGDFPARDGSLLSEIPANIKIYRTKIFEPYNLYRSLTGKGKNTAIDVENINKDGGKKFPELIAEFIRATFFIPDARRGWLRYAVKEGKEIIDEEKPDLIFSSAPPYTCALIAMKLKRYYYKIYGKQIPWISDFRDAWTGYLTSPKRWLIPAAIDSGYELKTLEEADAVTMVATGIKDDFDNKYPFISKNKKYFLIRNGFDSEDYRDIPFGMRKNYRFTIVYTGSMYGKRNPFFLISSLSELVKNGKVDINRIKFIFVGRMGADIFDFIHNCELKEIIEHVPYVPHTESIKFLLKSDAMLLLIDEDKYSKMILSGKVFEYLGAALLTGKPILAIAPEGEAADLIRETSAGEIIPHNNKEYLSKVFMKYYNAFLSGKKEVSSVNREAVKQYERKLLTGKLAEVFEKISMDQSPS